MKVRGQNNTHDGSRIFNNTLVDLGRKGISASDDQTTNIEIWNNIILDGGVADMSDSNPALLYCDYNLQWQAADPITCGSHGMVADPLFVDQSFNDPSDFKLQSGSPARGAGRNGEDIGAYAQGTEVIGRR